MIKEKEKEFIILIIFFHNGDCEIGNWQDDKKIGTFAYLTKNGEVKAKNY